MIDMDSSASDSAGNKASASTKLMSKLMSGFIGRGSGVAAVNNGLVGANLFEYNNVLFVDNLVLDAKATNAAGVSAKRHTTVHNPNLASYTNIAQVDLLTGTPTVDQHAP
jgi:hypothetical protein